MVLDWYPMTTLTTLPDEVFAESSEQPETTMVSAAARPASRKSLFFTAVPLADEIRHVDGDSACGTAGSTGSAIPTLVDMHIGLAVVRVDRERVQGTDVHAQRAALDTERLVDRHRHIGPLVHQCHGSLLFRLPRIVIRSPRMRMYSRSTGLPSSRLVRRSSMSSAAPSGTASVAAEWGSAETASSASVADPNRCPVTFSISAKTSLVSRGYRRTSAPMSGARYVRSSDSGRSPR